MTKLTEPIKREITKDWAEQFPNLGIYKPLWLLRRVGPLLEGICLNSDSSNERYQPIFHVHSLARPESSLSLTLADELRTTRNDTPEKIKAVFHKKRYVEAAQKMKRQALLSLTGDLHISDILRAYKTYMRKPLATYPLLLFEDMITTLLWCGQRLEAEQLAAECIAEVKFWPSSVPCIQRVVGPELWSQKCSLWLHQPEVVLTTVDEQIRIHGVQSLPTGELRAS